jgi:hypothetical protein
MVPLRFFIEIILPAAIGLGSTQALTEMRIRNISCEIKAAGAYHLPVQIVWISGSLSFLVASGLVQGLLYILQLSLLIEIIIAELLSN